MKKKHLFTGLLILILFAVGGYFAWEHFSAQKTYMPYNQFYNLVERGQVNTAVIKKDSIEFSCEGKEFKTENPDSPFLHEYLLQNSVSVTVEKDSTEIFNLIFDLIFYVFFFGLIILVFRKFISPNTFKVVHKTGVLTDLVSIKNNESVIFEQGKIKGKAYRFTRFIKITLGEIMETVGNMCKFNRFW